MFPLRLRAKKENQNTAGCGKSRKSGKWSINRGFCQGTPDKLKETLRGDETFHEVTAHDRLSDPDIFPRKQLFGDRMQKVTEKPERLIFKISRVQKHKKPRKVVISDAKKAAMLGEGSLPGQKPTLFDWTMEELPEDEAGSSSADGPFITPRTKSKPNKDTEDRKRKPNTIVLTEDCEESERRPGVAGELDELASLSLLSTGVCVASTRCFSVLPNEDTKISRVVNVVLERDQHGLGMCLISGPPNQTGHCPLLITNIKSNGPADREGTIKVGDRLLSIDGQRLTGLSVREAERLLLAPNGGRPVWLSIEYDVSVMSGVRAGGPVLVSCPPGTELGLSLVDSRSGVIVSGVRPASLAERTGAFLPGDQILAVNDCRIENTRISAEEVLDLIANSSTSQLQIEVLPVAAVNQGYSDPFRCSLNDVSQEHDFNDNLGSIQYNTLGKHEIEDDTPDLRIESGSVILNTTPGVGYGLLLRRAPSKRGAVICYIEPFGIADRSGVLQIGDRLLTVNGRPAEGCDRLEDLATLTVLLTVQFDVEVHSPLDGPLSVSLTRSQASGFGITVGYDKSRQDVLITNIKWGSVAHRSGWLSVGDQLLAINGLNVKGDLTAATQIADSAGTTVTFIVHKMSLDQGYSSPGLPSNSSGVDSWGSNNEEQPFPNDFPRQDSRETWKTDANNSTNSYISQQSDEETYSSMRLSESLLEALAGTKTGKPPSPPPCPLQVNYKTRKCNLPTHWRGSSSLNEQQGLNTIEGKEMVEAPLFNVPITFRTFHGSTKDEDFSRNTMSDTPPSSSQPSLFMVTLSKSKIFEDFGFSVSDGLYEKGVFINSIKPGSPADLSKMLKTYDKIIQVNDVPTHNLDCVMAVPLIASAETLTLTILRYDRRNTEVKMVPPPARPSPWSDLEAGGAVASTSRLTDSISNQENFRTN